MNFSQNYFELFGFPISPDIDKSLLSTRYRDLVKEVHPDQFASGTAQEQRISLQYATFINQAYEVLASPLKRFIYLLELRGIDLTEQDASAVDSDFLMQQIEYREALEELLEQDQPWDEIERINSNLDGSIESLSAGFSKHFSEPSSESLQRARTFVQKLQYLVKIKQELAHLEESLED